MFTRACLIGLGLYGSLAAYAAAQQKAGRDVVYEAARNRVGLLRYCREEKLLSAEVADIAIRVMRGELEAEPAAGQPLARKYGDYAEQDGEDGVLGPDSKRDVGTFAKSFKTTPTELCREWARESLRGVKGRSVQQAEPAPVPKSSAPASTIVAKPAAPSYLPPGSNSAVPKAAASAPAAKPVSPAPPLVITTAPAPKPLVIATVPAAKAPPPITPLPAEARGVPPITAATVMIIPPSAPPPLPAPVAAQSPAPAYAAPAELRQSRPPAFVPSDVQCP